MSATLLVLCTLVLVMAFLVITWFTRKKTCGSIFERIVFFILKTALSFAVVFFTLYFAMNTLYARYAVTGYESAKTIALSMAVLSIGMAAIAFINLRTLERIRKK